VPRKVSSWREAVYNGRKEARKFVSSEAMIQQPAPPREGPSRGSRTPFDGDPGQVIEVPVTALAPDPVQPRKDFREKSIRELAASIDQHGLLQPLLVRPMLGPDSRGRYWIVAGGRGPR